MRKFFEWLDSAPTGWPDLIWLGLIALVALGLWLLNRRIEHQRRERHWARLAYEDAASRLRQSLAQGSCHSCAQLLLQEVISSWEEWQRMEPVRQVSPEAAQAMELLEPISRIPM